MDNNNGYMHTKAKGNVGVLAVAKLLAENHINVFSEMGDLSRIDLIAERDGKLLRIQVKNMECKDGVVKFKTIKTGPVNYLYHYTTNDFDYFAIYVRNLDKVYFMKAEEALQRRMQVNLRVLPAKNSNEKNIIHAVKYEGINALVF